jgi:hypothetical protein
MEIVRTIHDVAIVVGFIGIVLIPRAILTYLAIQRENVTDQLG